MASPVPRGWSFSTLVNGAGAVSIVIPAGGPGVRHVLTDVLIKVTAQAALAGNFATDVQVKDGAVLLAEIGLLELNAAATSQDTDSSSLIEIGSPATSMTVLLNALAIANMLSILKISGYDM